MFVFMRPIFLAASLIAAIKFSTNAQQLFHGTSVVIYPNASSPWPGDSTFVAANFYCYFTPTGYVSFGWWLDATPGADHSHCTPRSSSYDWFEYTTSFQCNQSGCHTHAVNFLTSNPETPSFDDDYVLAALDIGNGELGELGLSYFDKTGGGYAVGTRRILDNDKSADSQMASDCHDAFHTLRVLTRNQKLDLDFQLVNKCPPIEQGDETQKFLSE